nr:GAF domain-containing protein [Streptomyces smaragdinus]
MPGEFAARVSQLLESMRSIGASLDLHSTLGSIAETAAELARARYASIVVIDSASGDLADFASYGVDEVDRDRIDDIPDTTLTVPIVVAGENLGDLVLAEKSDGGAFTRQDRDLVRIIATEAGIAIGNARLYEESRRRADWIDGASAVTTALLSMADARDALEVVAEQARSLANASAVGVLLPHPDGEGLENVAVSAEDPDGIVGTVIPWYSPAATKLREGEAVFVDDTASDPRMITKLGRRFGPCMLLPMRSGTRVLGSLVIARQRGDALFTESDKTMAAQFARQAAVALVMSEAQNDRERLAVYEDRDRIARDLHDLVIQRLFATGMMLQGAHSAAEADDVRERIDKAVTELDLTIQEIRQTIYSLQQQPPDAPTGVRGLVLREIAMASAPLGIEPSVSFVGPVDTVIDPATARHLLAALRELLSNAQRHAQATQIGVVIDATAMLPEGRAAVRLTVADDGVGLPDESERRASGLRNVEARAQSLGGSVWTEAGLGECGAGTSVLWQVPAAVPA